MTCRGIHEPEHAAVSRLHHFRWQVPGILTFPQHTPHNIGFLLPGDKKDHLAR